jgi:hypothetical protein
MGLEGPKFGGPINFVKGTSLLGITDTVKAHPLVAVVGLALGGWLAHKHISPWGAIWGGHQASHSRAKALHGSRRRRRR